MNKKLLLSTAASAAFSVCAVCTVVGPALNQASPSASASASAAKAADGNIYGFKAKSLDGKEIALDKYKGDVVLVVNTASQCGFTPQYKGLEELNKKYAAKGLKILGFPCNQFGAQEPGDSAQIASFCHKNYGVDFQMFQKIDVNGDKADPIYRYLIDSTDKQPIKWNFTKFLIDRKGRVVKRFDSKVTPEELDGDIEKLL